MGRGYPLCHPRKLDDGGCNELDMSNTIDRIRGGLSNDGILTRVAVGIGDKVQG
jgi:hypothetical protein